MGNFLINPLFLMLFEGLDDGTVSVESTRIEGMSDHIVLPVSHWLLMNNRLNVAQTFSFLETGAFDHELGYSQLMRRNVFRRTNLGLEVFSPRLFVHASKKLPPTKLRN